MDAREQGNALYGVAERRLCDDFPPTSLALTDPDGLLAVGGDLSPDRLISAYRRGIFPWYSAGQPILWWSPDPRTVLVPNEVHISRRTARLLRQNIFEVTCDRAFEAVVAACAEPRAQANGTWITSEMQAAYADLHRLGVAHCVETWCDGELCGGIYGVALGRMFFGESMFSSRSNASKVALIGLCARLVDWGYVLIDCQVHNPHLASLGAKRMDRQEFESVLRAAVDEEPRADAWAERA